MARINLIICDLCKEQIKEKDSGIYEITLTANKGVDADNGEVCPDCYNALLQRLKSPNGPKILQRPQKNLADNSDVTVDRLPIASLPAPEKSLGPSEEEKVKREPTKVLLDDEMVKVPSNFDRAIAAKVVREQRGACEHHFKSFKDGRVVCGNPPDGFEGELASFRGCGKVLTAAEY